MRITLRIIFSIFFVISAIVLLFTFLQVEQEKERMTIDLERRASILGESLKESIEPLVAKGQSSSVQKIVDKFGNRERLAGVAIYDAQGKLAAVTAQLTPYLKTPPSLVENVMSAGLEEGNFLSLGEKEAYLYALPLFREENVAGAMVMVYETKQIKDRVAHIWQNNFIRLLVSALFISLTTLLVIRWSMVHPIARMAEWMKTLRTEKGGASLPPPLWKSL